MINKPGRPAIADKDKNILQTFSLKPWQVRRLKETKNKSKLIQLLLTKMYTMELQLLIIGLL